MKIITRYWVIGFLILGLLVWGRSLTYPFVWDDEEQIVANTAVHTLDSWREIWTGSTFNAAGGEAMGGMYYKPLMTLNFALLYQLGEGATYPFRIWQLGLQILNSLMVVLLLKRFVNQQVVAIGLGLIFLIHPINAESVIYISALQDTLSFFWGIGGLLGLMYGTSRRWIGVGVVSVLLALFSKETGVLWLGIDTLYLLIFRRKWVGYWLLGVSIVMGLYLWLRLGVAGIGLRKHGLSPLSLMSLGERLWSVPQIINHYFVTLVLPIKLGIDQHWVVSVGDWRELGKSLILLLGICSGILYWGKRCEWRKEYWFGLLWLGGGMALHAQIFPLDMTVAERWFYVPMVAVLLLLALGWKRDGRVGLVGLVGVAILLTLLAGRSMIRVLDWQSGLRLYSRDVRVSPESFSLQNNLGVELYRIGAYERARPHFERAIQLSPTWWTSYNNLGVYWEQQGDWERALKLYGQAIENGHYYLAYENYGKLLAKMGRWEELEEYLIEAKKVLPNNPVLLELEVIEIRREERAK